jgi:thioredoxin-like negative regulator of GroEL
MRALRFMACVALVASVAHAGEAGRFRPASPDYVVLKVPASASSDPIAQLERRHAGEPGNEALAAELAQLYLGRARAEREPRYFARAEALVRPWASREDEGAPEARGARSGLHGATLRVQADILQNRHDFQGAMKLLDRAIALDPRDAAARLMRASVKLVNGRGADARADCAAVLAAGESTAGTICLAQVIGATGGLARAEALLETVMSRDNVEASTRLDARAGVARVAAQLGTPAALAASDSVRAWALWLLADFADRAGDAPAAETQLRAALQAAPQNEGIRSALSDLLLDRGAYREALALVDLPAPSIGLLARRARAQQALRDPALKDTRSQIDDLITLATRRGDPPHLREEALVALDVDHDPARALTLARANFETQRETIDLRILLRAAKACGDGATLSALTKWIHETGYEDTQLHGAAT